MGILSGLLNRYTSKRNEQYSAILGRMEYCSSFIDSVLATDGYIQKKAYSSELMDLNDTAENAAKLSGRIVLFQDDVVREFKEEYEAFQDKFNAFESKIDEHNTLYMKGKIKETRQLIGPIEGHDLDD